MKTYAKIMAASMIVTATGLFTALGPVQAQDWTPLREDPRIHSGLTAIAVGRHIRNTCDDISERRGRALTFALGLASHAGSLGFSRSEIDQFIDDPVEQEYYRSVARRYFAQNGADYDDAASVCQLGRDEIAAGSTIGRLLRGG